MNGFSFLTIMTAVFVAIQFGYIHFRRKHLEVSRVPGPLGIVFGFVIFIIVDLIISFINNIWFVALIPLLLFIAVLIVSLFAIKFVDKPEPFIRTFAESLLSSFSIFVLASTVVQIFMSLYSLENGYQDAELLAYLEEFPEYTLEQYKAGLIDILNEVAWAASINVIIIGVLSSINILSTDFILKTNRAIKIKDLIYGLLIISGIVVVFLTGASLLSQIVSIIITGVYLLLLIATFIKPLKFMNKTIHKIKD